MATNTSARSTTFEPRGPSLSIGTVGLFVNRITWPPGTHAVNTTR
jgi:hypothetical protein